MTLEVVKARTQDRKDDGSKEAAKPEPKTREQRERRDVEKCEGGARGTQSSGEANNVEI